ncbi:MAG: hypothetical protein J6X32_07020 [Salinivirgaceae bacterium]|nr:hypothetical protein [Salinivirgaceae bacterium]
MLQQLKDRQSAENGRQKSLRKKQNNASKPANTWRALFFPGRRQKRIVENFTAQHIFVFLYLPNE